MLYCSKCGAKLESDAEFCSKCGSKVVNSVEAAEPVKKRKSRWWLVLIILLVLTLVGAWWYFFGFSILNISFKSPSNTQGTSELASEIDSLGSSGNSSGNSNSGGSSGSSGSSSSTSSSSSSETSEPVISDDNDSDYDSDSDTVPEGFIIAPDCKDWDSFEDFENTIMNSYWKLEYQMKMSLDAEVGHEDYFPANDGIMIELEIPDDNKLYYAGYVIETGEELWKGHHDFVRGVLYLYVYAGSNIMYKGQEHEQGIYYYIDNDDYLVERWVIRNIDTGGYLFTSPANVFSSVSAEEVSFD